MDVLKVSSKSNPNSCAGALAGVIRHAGMAELQVVGAGALNQAIKAVAIARGFLASSGLDLVCVPAFADIEIEGQSRTAIRLLVEDRDHRHLATPGSGRAAPRHGTSVPEVPEVPEVPAAAVVVVPSGTDEPESAGPVLADALSS